MFGLPNLNSLMIGGAALGALLISSTGTASFYEKIIIPGREYALEERVSRERDLICLNTTQEAARYATEAARRQQSQAVDAALNGYRKSILDRELRRVANLERMEQEIADYERQISDEGGACLLDERSLGFLRDGA